MDRGRRQAPPHVGLVDPAKHRWNALKHHPRTTFVDPKRARKHLARDTSDARRRSFAARRGGRCRTARCEGRRPSSPGSRTSETSCEASAGQTARERGRLLGLTPRERRSGRPVARERRRERGANPETNAEGHGAKSRASDDRAPLEPKRLARARREIDTREGVWAEPSSSALQKERGSEEAVLGGR